jgi:hypothetical protein
LTLENKHGSSKESMAADSSEDVVQSLLRELDQLIVQAHDYEEALVSLVEAELPMGLTPARRD